MPFDTRIQWETSMMPTVVNGLFGGDVGAHKKEEILNRALKHYNFSRSELDQMLAEIGSASDLKRVAVFLHIFVNRQFVDKLDLITEYRRLAKKSLALS